LKRIEKPLEKSIEKPYSHLGINPEMFVCLAALSLYWGLHFGSYFSNTLLVPLDDSLARAPYLYLPCLAGATLFHGLVAFSRLARVGKFRILLFVGIPVASALTVSSFSVLAEVGLEMPVPLLLVAWLFYGFGLGALLLQSHAILSNANSEQVCFVIALGVVFSAMFFLAILNMNRLAAAATITIMVTILAVMLASSKVTGTAYQQMLAFGWGKGAPESSTASVEVEPGRSRKAAIITMQAEEHVPQSLRHLPRPFKHFLLELFFFSLVFGVAFLMVRSLPAFNEHSVYVVFAVVLPGVFLTAYSLILNRYINIRAILWILLGSMVIGLLPLAQFGGVGIDASAEVSCAFLVFGFSCYDMLSFYRLLSLLKTERLPFLKYFALGRFCNALAVMLGGSAVVLLLWFDLIQSTVFMILVVTLLLGLILLMLFLGYPQGHEENAPENKGSWRHACGTICERYKLTNREREIFELLAKGRDTVFISEKLYISSHTVKAHRNHVYAKLNIHSQQMLIDLVEQQVQRDRRGTNSTNTTGTKSQLAK
jgi:DNA-binding CsgD family transcriptional regulator